ncbi:hypothetical protein F1B92_08455, partial [Campylobacter sp. FMV-PI01]
DLNSTISDKEIKFTLNKATSVDENDSRVITSQAVFNEFKNYTKTSELGNEFLKKDGSNIGKDDKDKKEGRTKFGKNVGIEKIELNDSNKSTTELVQAQALINYLKGEGNHSVKISDSLKTTAKGDHSISIGSEAISENKGSIALGYNAQAKNKASISIGQNSNVTGEKSISIGAQNSVLGNFSFVLGENNTLNKEQTYVIGSDNNITGKKNISIGSRNKILGDDNILLGSNIKIEDSNITDAIVLGNDSTAEKTALSIGNESIKRRIANVAEPIKEYDAANKKYVDARGIKFKGSKNGEQLVKLDKTLTIDSSDAKYKKDSNDTSIKDIETSVSTDTNGTKLTLTLNKSDQVNKDDERAITSKAVATAIETVKSQIDNLDEDVVKYDKDSNKSNIRLGGVSADGVFTKPVRIQNLKSALDIMDDSNDKKYAELNKTKADKALTTLLNNKNADSLHQATNVTDLQALAISGLNFKGNDGKNIHKKLSQTLEIVGKGIDKKQAGKFNGTNGNIAVKENNQKLEISLSKNLSSIKKIKNDKFGSIEFNANDKNGPSKTIKNLILTGNGTKIILSHKGMHLNEKQLIGLKSGLDNNDLEKLINSSNNLENKAVNVKDLAKISKEIVEKGYKYNADVLESDDNKNIKLGSTISFNKLSSKTQTSANPNISDFVGENLITKYTYNKDGNAKIEIGFKNSPTFEKVTLSTPQKYGEGSINNNDLITKSYLEEALNSFKFKVADGNKTFDIGRGDTLKFNTGLNIGIKLDSNKTPSSTPVTTGTVPPTSTTTLTPPTSTTTPTNTTVGVTIGTTDELKDIKSISSPSDSNNQTTKLTLSSDSATLQTGDKGAKVEVNKDGIIFKPQKENNATNPSADQPSITINAGTASSGIDSFEPGKGPSIAFSAKKKDNNTVGFGEITGLRDLNASSDGTSAANKNYVDSQVKAINNNRPFEYYLDNDKIAKNEKGKFEKDGKELSEEEAKKVVIKAEPNSSPIGISNVASGLGLTAPETNSTKAKEIKKEIDKLAKAVEDGVKKVGEEANKLLTNAQKVTDLTLAVSGLEMAYNAMPDGNAKTEAKDKLDKSKKELEDAKKELDNAKTALNNAQKDLKQANKNYENKYDGYNKVAGLLELNGDTNLTKVATVGDLKAV